MEGLRRLRETKAASGMKGARGRCGGWQRGSVRLRRVGALGREMAFCACVEVGLVARFLTAPGRGRVLETPVRVRRARLFFFPFPPAEVLNFPMVKQSRLLLVAVATT